MDEKKSIKTPGVSNISGLAGEVSAILINNMKEGKLEVSISYMEQTGKLIIEGFDKESNDKITYEIGRMNIRAPYHSQFTKANRASATAECIDEDFSLLDLVYNHGNEVYFKPIVRKIKIS